MQNKLETITLFVLVLTFSLVSAQDVTIYPNNTNDTVCYSNITIPVQRLLQLSALATRMCEKDKNIVDYLDSEMEKLENNSCANLTDLLSTVTNNTLINDALGVLEEFMEDVIDVTITVVEQNDTSTTNLTWIFTVKLEIDGDIQDLISMINSEFCKYLTDYYNAYFGIGIHTSLCNPSLVRIVNETSHECSNTSSPNVTVPSPTVKTRSININSTTETNVTTPAPSPTVIFTNETVNGTVPVSPTVISTNETVNGTVPTPSPAVISTNETVNGTVPTPSPAVISTNVTVNGTVPVPLAVVISNCTHSNFTSTNDTNNAPSPVINNNTTSNINSTKTYVIFTISVYMFPCGSTTINETQPVVIGNNIMNNNSTIMNNTSKVKNGDFGSGGSILGVSIFGFLLLAYLV